MKRNFLFSFFIVAEVILSSGCGTQQEIPKTTAFYQVVDSAGRTVELEKKPKRVVLLATAFPEILLAVDGDFEAWANNPSIKRTCMGKGKKDSRICVRYQHRICCCNEPGSCGWAGRTP